MTYQKQISVLIKGAGEMASAIAWRLYQANIKCLLMLEVEAPMAVRRDVSFSEAIHDGSQVVEGIRAEKIVRVEEIEGLWQRGIIAVMTDPSWDSIEQLRPSVVVDAILAKRNLGTGMGDAPLVIGLGPGFTAGKDVHLVVETNRGHHLGRIIDKGSAAPNTGIPGNISGVTKERVLRAETNGRLEVRKSIGEPVRRGEVVGMIGEETVCAKIDGVLRGFLRHDTNVKTGWKLGDIDPRGDTEYCRTISDKARAISGSVLEAILRVYPPFH